MARASRVPLPARPAGLDPNAYDSIARCRGVRSARKREYLLALDACGGDDACSSAAHLLQCRGKKRKGPKPKGLLPDEGLGLFVEENTFIKYTAAVFGKSIAAFRKQLNAMISYHEKRLAGLPTTESERIATIAFMRTTVHARSDDTAWVFRNPSRSPDAFAGLVDGWLGHRLGLNVAPSGEIRLTFGFPAAHVDELRLPTFYDVPWNFLPLWDSSGRTKPLPRTPTGMTGLEELVGNPPEIGRINRPVLRINLEPR
jgi:hypothetical protein